MATLLELEIRIKDALLLTAEYQLMDPGLLDSRVRMAALDVLDAQRELMFSGTEPREAASIALHDYFVVHDRLMATEGSSSKR